MKQKLNRLFAILGVILIIFSVFLIVYDTKKENEPKIAGKYCVSIWSYTKEELLQLQSIMGDNFDETLTLPTSIHALKSRLKELFKDQSIYIKPNHTSGIYWIDIGDGETFIAAEKETGNILFYKNDQDHIRSHKLLIKPEERFRIELDLPGLSAEQIASLYNLFGLQYKTVDGYSSLDDKEMAREFADLFFRENMQNRAEENSTQKHDGNHRENFLQNINSIEHTGIIYSEKADVWIIESGFTLVVGAENANIIGFFSF